MIEVLNKEYITFSHAKGLRQRVIIVKHSLRNALPPIITVIAFQFGVAFGGTVILEFLFFWPGIGQLTLSAIKGQDFPLVQSAVVVIALVFMLSNFVADVLQVYFDPEVEYGGES
jgi:peptide/nickel transport system permease protein